MNKVIVTNVNKAKTVNLRYNRGTKTVFIDKSLGSEHVDFSLNRVYKSTSGPDVGPMHYHSDTENVYYILSGKYSIRTPDEQFDLEAGDVVFIPKGVPHSGSNRGDEDAVILEIYAPCGGFDEDFHESK